MLSYYFFLCLCFIPLVKSQGCKNDRVGTNRLDGDRVVGAPADSYFLACGKDFTASCCARVTSWRYEVDRRSPVDFFIWRNHNSTFYEVITIESANPTNGGENTHAPAIFDVIVQPGDCLGWKADGNEVIEYGRSTRDGIPVLYMDGISPSIGSVEDWSGASATVANAEFAIYARVRESNSPSFPTQATTYTVQDSDVTLATAVPLFSFTDLDAKDSMTLSMTSTPTGYLFLTDNGNGVGTIQLANAVMPISGQTITVTVSATDVCGRKGTATINVLVNNNPPDLTRLVANVTVPECLLTETPLGNFTCSDSSGVVSVTITEDPAKDLFFVVPTAGLDEFEIVAKSQVGIPFGAGFDYDTQPTHNIIVTCRDGAGATATGTMTVNIIRNNPPVIAASMATVVYIDKLTGIGEIAYVVPFTDLEGDQPTLSLTPTTAPFEVFDDGRILLTEDLMSTNLTTWNVDIGIRDPKHVGISKPLTIIVTGVGIPTSWANLPKHVTVPENSPIGTSIYQVFYAGTPRTIHWSNPNGGTVLFGYNTADGNIKTLSGLDYETLNPTTYLMVFEIADNITSATGTLTIEVTDVNEPLVWSSSLYRSYVIERQNSIVVSIECISVIDWTPWYTLHDITCIEGVGVGLTDPSFRIDDPDRNDTHLCTMNCGNYSGYFTMDNTTCKVTIASTYSLDASLPTNVTCNLTATDTKPHTATSALLITIDYANNHAPVFINTTDYKYKISPYIGLGVNVGKVSATDDDIGDFGNFSYALINQTSPHYFKIDGTSGMISTASKLLAVCSTCNATTMTLLVTVTDTGGLVTTATVTIEIDALTTVTIIVTEKYLKFADDEKNIIWLSCAIALLAITTIVGIYICFRYVLYYDGKWCNFKRGVVRWKPNQNPTISRTLERRAREQQQQQVRQQKDLVSCRPQIPEGGHAWQRDGML